MILVAIYDGPFGRHIERCQDGIAEHRIYELRNALNAEVHEFDSMRDFMRWNDIMNEFSDREIIYFLLEMEEETCY